MSNKYQEIRIFQSTYKDQDAVTLESSLIKAQVLPKIGSNMCSFFYKPKNIELLAQSLYDKNNKKYKIEPYDGNLSLGEASGFDECFPTIDECFYPSYPWKGIRIPRHGEVWSLPWDARISGDKLITEVYGVRFPYRIKKTIYFTDENILRIDYLLENLSSFSFDFMWVAHPNFMAQEGAEILLPEGVKSIITTHSPSGMLGSYGQENKWPVFISDECGKVVLNKMRPKSVKDWNKYYVNGKMPEGWCALTYPASGLILGLSFPESEVPYLAILPNEGGFGDDAYSILLEPCTSSFDRLDIAKIRGQCSSVWPKSKYSWYLNLTVSENSALKNINEDGYIV